MSDKITMNCAHCGGTWFELPDNPRSNDIVTCVGCGAKSTYSALQEQAIAEAKTLIENTFRNAFKNVS